MYACRRGIEDRNLTWYDAKAQNCIEKADREKQLKRANPREVNETESLLQ